MWCPETKRLILLAAVGMAWQWLCLVCDWSAAPYTSPRPRACPARVKAHCNDAGAPLAGQRAALGARRPRFGLCAAAASLPACHHRLAGARCRIAALCYRRARRRRRAGPDRMCRLSVPLSELGCRIRRAGLVMQAPTTGEGAAVLLEQGMEWPLPLSRRLLCDAWPD